MCACDIWPSSAWDCHQGFLTVLAFKNCFITLAQHLSVGM